MSGRRDFLRGLVTLPMIGGSVALIGQPTAVAEEPSLGLLVQYANWLFYERRMLSAEVAALCPVDLEHVAYLRPPPTSLGRCWPDYFPDRQSDMRPPSTRAALVMSAADFDWRERA